MFGLFKKPISSNEFGQGLIQLVIDPVSSDAGRALGVMFEDFDGSRGWAPFLESRGVALEKQKLHFRLFLHGAIQAASTQFSPALQKEITYGAMDSLRPQNEYDFGRVFESLENIYKRRHQFSTKISQLKGSTGNFKFLADADIGTLNAKFLMEAFVIPKMHNHDAFEKNFSTYSGVVSTGIATACRGMEFISKKFRIE